MLSAATVAVIGSEIVTFPIDAGPARVSAMLDGDDEPQEELRAEPTGQARKALRAVGPPSRVGKPISREDLVERVGDGLAQMLLFRDWFTRPEQGDADWVPVAWFEDPDDHTQFFTFCAMVDTAAVPTVLRDYEWPFEQSIGQPDFMNYGGEDWYYDDGRVRRKHGVTYYPFVFSRYFPQSPSRFDLVQEFELYHNAFWEGKELRRVDSAGNVHVLARYVDSDKIRGIEVHRHHLRDFLAAKRCALLRVHELMRRLDLTLTDRIREDRVWVPLRGERSYFEVLVCTDWDPEPTLTKCSGRDVVPPYDAPLPYHTGDDDEGCESFIIGRDDQGREIVASCDGEIVDTVAGAPFLTPVFFGRPVLGKYYQEPTKYVVEPTHVRCHGLWDIDIDILDGRLVQVWLGDLARIPR